MLSVLKHQNITELVRWPNRVTVKSSRTQRRKGRHNRNREEKGGGGRKWPQIHCCLEDLYQIWRNNVHKPWIPYSQIFLHFIGMLNFPMEHDLGDFQFVFIYREGYSFSCLTYDLLHCHEIIDQG